MRSAFSILCALILNASCGAAAVRDTAKQTPGIPHELPYFFTKKPFISPLIIEDLSTWISDGGDQVVAINLIESHESNRYYGDIQTYENPEIEYPYVYVQKGDEEAPVRKPEFGYQYVGKTPEDIYILRTADNGGGTLTMSRLILLVIEKDTSLRYDLDSPMIKEERVLLKKIGSVTLASQTWDGKVEFDGKTGIFIGDSEEPPGRWIQIKR